MFPTRVIICVLLAMTLNLLWSWALTTLPLPDVVMILLAFVSGLALGWGAVAIGNHWEDSRRGQ